MPGHRPPARPERLHARSRGVHGKKNAEIVDLTAYGCPLHYVKARNELRRIAAGGSVTFLFCSADLAQQAASSLSKDGHTILGVEPHGNAVCVSVRKEGALAPEREVPAR